MTYKVKTPVALIVFNRYDNARQIFERVKTVKPAKLYVIADGPRSSHPGDIEKCKRVRSIYDQIDWDCEVFRNYSETNLGCSQRPFTGISWVLEQEERAIILEDDCLPDPTFFRFCDEMLERYKDDDRVMQVAGSNTNVTWKRGEYSYHFAKFSLIHGWATWRRAWAKMDINISNWNDPVVKQVLKDRFEPWYYYAISHIYDRLVDNSQNTSAWDYQWGFARRLNNGLSVVPCTNLITNIGFGPDSTHTVNKKSKAAALPSTPLNFPLKHPPFVMEDTGYDKVLISLLYPKTLKIWLWRRKNELKEFLKRTR